MKRLALFFDGTNNTPKDRTNVWRTHELLADADASGSKQLRRYIEGVGTDVGRIAVGSIFGAGVIDRICDGYQWLAENYDDGDEIFVFGFSRGAFTARSLVQMISNVGLTRPSALSTWTPKDAFERYEAISRQDTPSIHPIWRLRYWERHTDQVPVGLQASDPQAARMTDANVRLVKVKMAGLWDTVGAIGTDAIKSDLPRTQKIAEHNVRPTKAQDYGYHALAIDEHRPMFEATLWRRFVPTSGDKAANFYNTHYEQRWFVGAHSDVGGGYGEDSLPDLSLEWMMSKAGALGLAFTHRVNPVPGSWLAETHDSFEAFAGGVLNLWDKVKPGDQRRYREMSKDSRPMTLPDGTPGSLQTIRETIDPSVAQRWSEDPRYRPPSLVEYYRRRPSELPPGTTTAQHTRRIHACEYWNKTGVFLEAGRTYRVRVVPGVGEPLRDGVLTARSIAGEDWSTAAHKTASMLHGKRETGAAWFALIGTVDKKEPWVITDGSTFSVRVGGELLCYFNDVRVPLFYRNNTGWVILEVEAL